MLGHSCTHDSRQGYSTRKRLCLRAILGSYLFHSNANCALKEGLQDRTCVDEILALDPGKLKFAKRKLRVQRCKSIPNAASKNVPPSERAQTSNRAPVPSVPKGDPSLGEKLVKLTKEERKRVKAADADRVARRMAKKKARIGLAKQGVPLQRERVRKTGTAKKLGGAPAKKASKGRVRSEKSIAKRNTKK